MVTTSKNPSEAVVVSVRVEEWPLDLIDDNPFNPRLYYNPAKVQARADSIEQNGLLHKPRARMMLILQAQLTGNHVNQNYSYSTSGQLKFLSDYLKIKDDSIASDKLTGLVSSALEKLSDQEMARLIVSFMLNFLTYKEPGYGYYGSDSSHHDYKIQTTEVLNWMGVGVQVEKPGEDKKNGNPPKNK